MAKNNGPFMLNAKKFLAWSATLSWAEIGKCFAEICLAVSEGRWNAVAKYDFIARPPKENT